MNRRVRTRRDFLKAGGLCVAGAAVTGCMGDGPRYASPMAQTYYPPRPNILWITCEDTSPYLGCYGDPLAVTPNLNRLAGRSILYTNAYATAPVCSPSRSCLITGVYATSLGTQHLRSEVAIPRRIEPFPKLLRAAGYYCSNNCDGDYNFKDSSIWNDSSPTAHWRNRPAGQQFFSVLNLLTTHQSQINGSDEEFEARCGSKLSPSERHDPRKMLLPPYYPDTPTIRKMWARYYDLITLMDKQVGEILDQLEADGLAESTVVFFFSDHGLGAPRFKRTLYDSGLRVPLLVRIPASYQRLAAYAAGGRTDQLVSFVDFAPTVLLLAGAPIPSTMEGQPFLGKLASSPREYVFGATGRVDEAYETSRCVRDKRFKYIRNFLPHLPYAQPSDYCDKAEIMQELRSVAASGGLAGMEKLFWEPTKPVEELYDTLLDPHEVRNLADSFEHRATLDRMRTRLRDWMLGMKDVAMLSEAEMHIRASGSTPYDMAHDPAKFRLANILDAADLVGRDASILPAMVELLADADSAVRYWAVMYFASLGAEAAPATEALKKMLDDPSPDVRLTSAGVLCGLGSCDESLPVLATGLLDPRGPVALRAARTVEGIGDKAAPLVGQMELARQKCKGLDGNYLNDNYAMFIDWALQHAIENCKQ